MSHFTVLVIGDNPEKQLAPFQENNMGDCPKEYLEFFDVWEEDYKEIWETGSAKKVKMPDGRLLDTHDEEFEIEVKPRHFEYKIPEEYEVIKIPYKELYTSPDEFMEKHAGYKKDKETGKYGYWENPHRKWDWYQIGGRWNGFFKLKKGAQGNIGSPSWASDPNADYTGRADQARKCGIDIEGMRQEAREKAEKRYDDLLAAFGGEIPKIERSWQEILDDKSIQDINEKRKIYHAQDALTRFQEIRCKAFEEHKGREDVEHSFIFDNLSEYQGTREEYIERAVNAAISFFAVVKDSKWYEKGEMGWWAVVSNEKDPNKWTEEMAKLIDEVPDDTLFTLVDCHI